MTDVTRGQLLLLGYNILARVENTTTDGFDFYVQNGAWNGRYIFEGERLFMKELNKWHEGIKIICAEQPPNDVLLGGYNSVIPWMLSQVSA
jgi:hypothetical protein